MTAAVDSLYRGFRDSYLDYETLTAQLKAWAEAYPEFVRLQSLAKTDEGRDLWLLTLGPDPDRRRPAAWIDGNMHALEVSGSSAALAVAESVIRLHADPAAAAALGLTPGVAERLRDVLFHVMPRMSPDGAERVLKTGRFLRSVPHDDRLPRERPFWRVGDVDGDGQSLMMRVQDPAGDYVESRNFPGRMLLREIDDEGPFYRLYPEGFIENFDGETVPAPHFLDDNPTDLNRNFPYAWMPPYVQEGAGDYPMSETESRAVVEFTSAHPNLFAWLNLHTFGGVFIRPLGHKPDNEMEPGDLAIFRQIEAWGERYTGYPTVSGFEEFTYKPNKPLHGDLTDYAYHQRGCIAYVCELWDLFEQVGLPRPKRFVDRYTRLDRAEAEKIYRWDAEHNQGRLAGRWRPFRHPQLGDVEVGGPDPRIGIWNPPLDRLAEVCNGQAAAFLRVAAMAPRLELKCSVEPLAKGLHRVRCEVANLGYLPSFVLESSRNLDWNEPVTVSIEAEGC
ncbi:MAG: M14 family metallopeptidase, partial [Steroidobacteraceae bacterium]|nr:M14 family metallopeptidase [Steroidobacteraceae bacterium]